MRGGVLGSISRGRIFQSLFACVYHQFDALAVVISLLLILCIEVGGDVVVVRTGYPAGHQHHRPRIGSGAAQEGAQHRGRVICDRGARHPTHLDKSNVGIQQTRVYFLGNGLCVWGCGRTRF